MDCLDNLIALDHTCAAPDGVLTLQTIGITERLLSQVTNEDEGNAAALLANVERNAKAIVRSDVVSFFADRIVPRTLVDAHGIGAPNDNADLLSGVAGGRGGIVLEVGSTSTNIVLRIGAAGLWVDGAVTDRTVSVHDLSDGSLVTTFDVSGGGDSITRQAVQVVLPARRRHTSYFISTQEPSFYKVDTYDGAGCASCRDFRYTVGGLNIWSARLPAATAVRRPNLRSTSHTSGLLLTVTMECDHAQLLCEIKDRIALPYLYKVGQLVYERALYAFERLNPTTIDKEALAMRHDRMGEEYSKAMTNILGRMRLPEDPVCFLCNSRAMTRTVLP